MKKQTKSKRTPPRRKPLRKPKFQKPSEGAFHISQEMLDEVEAEHRAMRESMPPAILEEYLRIGQIKDDVLSANENTRMNEILDEYDRPASEEVTKRHLADIAREREQAVVQLPQQDETAS